MTTPDAAAVREAVESLMSTLRSDLEALVRIPSVAFPGYPPQEVRRAADEVARILRDAGYDEVRLIDLPGGMPAVYAQATGPEGAPTVLLYAHYDVQPSGDETAWYSPPFEPTERDGRVYGRGAADDKSGVIIHAGVLRALRALDPGGALPCTVRVIVEGEEEYGGKFEDYPRENPDLFAADAIVVSDMGNLRLGEPTFTVALRGMVDCVVEVRTLEGPVHSGMFGGPAPDALMTLITLLATLRTEDGSTAVPGVGGFDWEGPEYPQDAYRSLAGIVEGQPLVGEGSLSSRLFSLPVANVTGLDAPSVGAAINAVIPVARAKVSLRLPPGVDDTLAMAQLVGFLRDSAPWGVQVEVTPGSQGVGLMVDSSGPAYEAARRAMHGAYGLDAVEIGAGGSIPLIDVLHQVVPGAELLLFGAQDPMARIHAPNESVDLGELTSAVVAQTLFLVEMAHYGGTA